MDTYNEYSGKVASEKIVLAKINAKERLMGWSVYSGTVYSISVDYKVLASIAESGSAYTEKTSIAAITTSSYYYDRTNGVLYLETSDSTHPNGKFIAATITYFFSNHPVKASNNLSTGYDVFWEPLITTLAKFGVELDNQDQIGLALEGSGRLSLLNDVSFWQSRYDNFVWENQVVDIYSWTRDLPITEAKKIYSGRVNSKKYSAKNITFGLKDLISEIRSPMVINDIEDLSGERVIQSLSNAKQRIIYGKVSGFRPTNIDQTLDTGYPITGTVGVTASSATLTGSGTAFFDEVSPNDQLIINGNDVSVSSITSDTSLELTETYPGVSVAGQTATIIPEVSKKYINRVWQLSGHAINEPSTTIFGAFSQNRFKVVSDTDLFAGDDVYVDSSEVVTISTVSSNLITLTGNLATTPTTGTTLLRIPVQDVKINDRKLIYIRDYTVNATTGVLTLEEDAESNISPVYDMNGTISFTASSRAVTGSGTNFERLKQGQWIRNKVRSNWYEISSIESETALTIKTVSAHTDSGVSGQYKVLTPFDNEVDVLSCDIYGKESSGVLIRTGAEIVKDILTDNGLSASLNAASFTQASADANQLLGLAIPENYSDTSVENIRETINKINLSIFGALVQNEEFELEYNILRPGFPSTMVTFKEYDIIKFTIETINDRIVKTVSIKYLNKEYDSTAGEISSQVSEKTSDIGLYLTGSTKQKDLTTYLTNSADAAIFANRWAFLLELGSSILKMTTKLQASRMQVNDKVEILHKDLYDRIGGGQHKIMAVQSLKQDGASVEIEAEDLANAFTRVCTIAPSGTNDFSEASDTEKFRYGFITDSYGLIGNDKDTFNLQLIW